MVRAHVVIFIAEPDMWMVAHRGTVKPAISSETPFCCVCLKVTGMVAALDDVPKAVMYAGSIFHKRRKGFFFTIHLLGI